MSNTSVAGPTTHNNNTVLPLLNSSAMLLSNICSEGCYVTLGGGLQDAPMVMWPRWLLSLKSSCLGEEKEVCCDSVLPQLQVGGTLHKRHMAELGSNHEDHLRVPHPGLSMAKSAQPFGLPLFIHRAPAFISHNSCFILFLLRHAECLLGLIFQDILISQYGSIEK